MKKLLTVLFVGLLCTAHLRAFDETNVSYSAKTGIMSEYLGSIGSIFYKSPVSVNEIDFGYSDWYGGIWNSTGLGGTKYGQTYGDEFDFYGGWAHTFDWIKIDLSSTYYAIARLDTTSDDLWVIEPEISLPKFPFVQPYIRGRYFGQVGSESPKPGFFWFGGLRKDITFGKGLADRAYSLDLQASTAYAAGALHSSTGFVYGRLTVSLDAPLSKHWTLSPTVICQAAAPGQRSDPNGFTDGNKFVYGVSLECKW